MRTNAEKRCDSWRYYVGVILFGLAALLILAGVAKVVFESPGDVERDWGILLLAGTPEILCLAAAMILGKENYEVLARHSRALQQNKSSREVSRLRYYAGLTGCFANAIPLMLYAYVPERLPTGATKMSILLIADLVFVGSLFFAGGEFWEKLRRLFVWEGSPAHSSAHRP